MTQISKSLQAFHFGQAFSLAKLGSPRMPLKKSMKHIRPLLVALIILLLPARVHAQNPFTNGLVAYYPFNGNANDASGNGNQGTVSCATLATDRFGNANSAYYFAGDGSDISVSDSSTLDITNALTLSAWIKIEAGGLYQPRILE